MHFQTHHCRASFPSAITNLPSAVSPAVAAQQSCAIWASNGLKLPPHVAREAHSPRVQAQLPRPGLRTACPLPCLERAIAQVSRKPYFIALRRVRSALERLHVADDESISRQCFSRAGKLAQAQEMRETGAAKRLQSQRSALDAALGGCARLVQPQKQDVIAQTFLHEVRQHCPTSLRHCCCRTGLALPLSTPRHYLLWTPARRSLHL